MTEKQFSTKVATNAGAGVYCGGIVCFVQVCLIGVVGDVHAGVNSNVWAEITCVGIDACVRAKWRKNRENQ